MAKPRTKRKASRHGFTRAQEGRSTPVQLAVQALSHFERAGRALREEHIDHRQGLSAFTDNERVSQETD